LSEKDQPTLRDFWREVIVPHMRHPFTLAVSVAAAATAVWSFSGGRLASGALMLFVLAVVLFRLPALVAFLIFIRKRRPDSMRPHA